MKTGTRLAALFLFLAVLLCGSVAARAANHPLSPDDITLLLIGGASPQRMVGIIQQRGIDFRLNPDLVKQFYQDGATDDVIDALQRASQAVKSVPSSAPTSTSPSSSAPSPAAAPGPISAHIPPSEMPAPAAKEAPAPAATPGPSMAAGHAAPAAAPPAGATVTKATSPPHPAPSAVSNAPLKDPSAAQIQPIIQTFAAKEKLFEEARDNYTYHQINKVETLDADDQVDGVWEQDWDILFDDNGQRIERVTYAPESTLKNLLVTEQDLQSLRSINPFVLSTNDLPEYDVKYLGHVRVDYITAYVFSVRPKEIKKGHEYFKGVVWVDDHDFQIVKAEGRMVPQLRNKNGQNLFPRFTTWRQQIDGKYWFPTFTMADDTLYFDSGPIHIREVIKYTDYKQFKSKTRIISSTPINLQGDAPKPSR